MTHRRTVLAALVVGLLLCAPDAHAQEKMFGTEVVEPGIEFTFLAAPKDDVDPQAQNLAETQTDIHLEVLATWTAEASASLGAVEGGFVPYLHLFARVTNEETGRTKKVSLVPHINTSDNAHYARNIALPGAADDPFTITFSVNPPGTYELATHHDWRQAVGDQLLEPATVTYDALQLEAVAQATRE
jgi:uncharacterized protein involved in high-affinity Fe2+ transport